MTTEASSVIAVTLSKHRPSLIERAFLLARTGASLETIRRQLNCENYCDVDLQLSAATLKRQLKAAGAQAAERSRLRGPRRPRSAETERQAPSMQFKKCAVCGQLLSIQSFAHHNHVRRSAEAF